MLGIEDQDVIRKIGDNITARQYWAWIHFFVKNYSALFDVIPGINKSGWFNQTESHIEELTCTLSVISWIDTTTNNNTIRHEWQHNRNSYFMTDKVMTDKGYSIDFAKDEIIAFLRGWESVASIQKILTKPESQWWWYQYGLEWDKREYHTREVRWALGIVRDLINLTESPENKEWSRLIRVKNIWLTKDNVISMLSSTPIHEWHNLYLNIIDASKNNNTLWWVWTAEKQTEINEINQANSIDKIKHILNDPKYSHISRWPNNRWWIEISAMIDDVVAWKLDISYIPNEIRQQVQKFINK